MGTLKTIYFWAILSFLIAPSTALTREQENAADKNLDEKFENNAEPEDDPYARSNKPSCICPPPESRDVSKIPNSSKVCGYELQEYQRRGQAKNCDPQTLYRCRLVAVDEPEPAKEVEKCEAPTQYCRKKGNQANARICSEYRD